MLACTRAGVQLTPAPCPREEGPPRLHVVEKITRNLTTEPWPVAQWLQHWPMNQKVMGSIPDPSPGQEACVGGSQSMWLPHTNVSHSGEE